MLLLYIFLAVVNACKSNPCKHGGTCSTHGIDYKCTCMIGYGGNDCDEGWYCFHYYYKLVGKQAVFYCTIICSSK